jgi:opacity protein-like surface antigen
VWHPSRAWWVSARVAAKRVQERFFNNERNAQSPASSRYEAAQVSGRLIYDVTENWDIGVLGSVLQGRASGEQLSTRQYAAGLELGYNVATNLWVSAGYNATGYNDRDFSANDYTNRGAYIRLRYKFDEDLFKGADKESNRSLAR